MLDIDTLLQPVSAENPAGNDLSFSPEFDAIQEARRSDDATLDQGEWVTELKASDWPTVIRNCGELLATRSKDLRLAVWMAEACTHTDGFAGLADGYRLVAGLCERYWDDLHPIAEDDDQELRVGNLSWMLSQSINWMRAIPLTDTPGGRYSMVDLEQAARANGDGQNAGAHPDATRIDAARAATSFEFYQRLAAQLPLAQEALAQLEHSVDAKLGQSGPSFSATRDALDSVASSALRLITAAGVMSGDVTEAPAAPNASDAPATTNAKVGGPITTRRDALMQLQQVAEFFRRTEPHSPVAYLADRAARWGSMPLHVWLKTVLKDNPALGQLQELLGVVGEDGGEG
jgi:type VI secretion system protein ImpA